MVNKLSYLCGALLCIFGLPFGLYLSFEDIYNVYSLNSSIIEVSYFFAISPIIIWLISIVIIGNFSLLSKGKISLSDLGKKTLGVYMPLGALISSVLMGYYLKPAMVNYLIDHGYQLKETIRASAPWRPDTDIYVLEKKSTGL